MPAYGDDSYPLEWPWSLDLVLELVGPDTVVVPGHGAPVGLDFVQEQRSAIGVVAQTIRDLAGSGVPVDRRWTRPSGPTRSEHLVTPYDVATSSSPRSAEATAARMSVSPGPRLTTTGCCSGGGEPPTSRRSRT